MGKDLPLLAPTVRERARILSPCLLAALAIFALARPLLPPTSDLAYVFVWGFIALLAAITVYQRKHIPDRWILLASAAQLWCALGAALAVVLASGHPVYLMLLVIVTASGGVILHPAYAIGAVATAVAIGAVAIIVRADAHAAAYVLALVTAGLFAGLIHVLMRRAIVREATQRARFADKVEELERSQAERASLAEQLLHAQRMEAVGTLAAGIAHDMNNVLAAITSFASLALDEVREASTRSDIEQVLKQADRGASLTRGLLAFSRRGQYRKQVVKVEDVISEVLPLLRHTMPKSIELVTDIALAGTCVEGDPVHMHQILINLGLNAADAMGGTGTLTIRASADRKRRALIEVSDTGKGMDAETRLRVFEPFFTTKPKGQGTGLGLAIVWGIVQAHGGTIEVSSEPGKGATFRIQLPLTDRQPTLRSVARLSSPTLEHRATVLVVDDEAMVRASTKRLLEKQGVAVLTAGDGEEALEIFMRDPQRIELVVLDMGMPVMGGAECFRRIRGISDVPVLIATGYSSDTDAQELVNAGASLIEKPFSSALLWAEVSRLLRRADAAAG